MEPKIVVIFTPESKWHLEKQIDNISYLLTSDDLVQIVTFLDEHHFKLSNLILDI
jgi:hypothetical protein